VKVHRPPVDLAGRRAARTAQLILARVGFPCAEPVGEIGRVDGRVVSIETLLDAGHLADGHQPAVRAAIAEGLAQQVRLLQAHPSVVGPAHQAPAWCRYQLGPWPTPHDPFFDFRTTPAGWSWLDTLAQDATEAMLQTASETDELVVAHADWYCGNLRFDGARLVACFDWDLLLDRVAVVAGLTAGMHTHGSANGVEQDDPTEVAHFLIDFERSYGRTFTEGEQRAAAAAATWSACYAARCQLQTLGEQPDVGSPLGAVQRYGPDYLAVRW
jgi:hypothetical protein